MLPVFIGLEDGDKLTVFFNARRLSIGYWRFFWIQDFLRGLFPRIGYALQVIFHKVHPKKEKLIDTGFNLGLSSGFG